MRPATQIHQSEAAYWHSSSLSMSFRKGPRQVAVSPSAIGSLVPFRLGYDLPKFESSFGPEPGANLNF